MARVLVVRMKKEKIYLIVLILYIIVCYCFAVLGREPLPESDVRLELFKCYDNPSEDIVNDICTNIAVFIPIGLLVGIVSFHRHAAGRSNFSIKQPILSVIWALLVGLLFSLCIEFSQLLTQRGVSDVDDIFNNTLGAVIGGVVAAVVLFVLQAGGKKAE